jgi:peptide-methionine (S)-S-oxide reductase
MHDRCGLKGGGDMSIGHYQRARRAALGLALRGLALAAVAAGVAGAWSRLASADSFGTAAGPPPAGLAVATFAGGCFWCMEPPFDALDGVVSTTSGYTGGRTARPSYREVGAGGTGHLEAVRVVFDPARISYERLLEVFWRNVDPFDAGGQFCDRGASYRTAIFVHDAAQRRLAEASKAALEAEGRPSRRRIATEIREAGPFWPAEDYHQDYYLRNPVRYRFYRWNCGRDARLREVWGAAAGGDGAH